MKKVIAFVFVVVFMISGVFIVFAEEDNSIARTWPVSMAYESESNNTASTADKIDSNGVGYGKISSTSDVDWWYVEFEGSGYVDFTLTNIPSGCNYELKLYGSDGVTLFKTSTKSGNQNELISEYWVWENSKFYIQVYSSSGTSTSSYYQLGIEHEAYHAYAGAYIGAYRGITANITLPTSYPNASDSGESVWVSTSGDSNGEWIQVGARYFTSTGQFDIYAEYFENGEYQRNISGTHALGTTREYRVEYRPYEDLWYAYCSTNVMAASTMSSSTLDVQAHGEVHKKNIQMGPFTFSNVKVKNSSSQWVDNTQAPTTADGPYHVTGTPTNFTVYGP